MVLGRDAVLLDGIGEDVDWPACRVAQVAQVDHRHALGRLLSRLADAGRTCRRGSRRRHEQASGGRCARHRRCAAVTSCSWPDGRRCLGSARRRLCCAARTRHRGAVGRTRALVELETHVEHLRGHLSVGLDEVHQLKAVLARRPRHGQGGEALGRDGKGAAAVARAALRAEVLRRPQDEAQRGLEHVEVRREEQRIEVLHGMRQRAAALVAAGMHTHLKRVVQLAVRAVLEQQAREAQQRDEEQLALRRKVVDLQAAQVVVAHRLLENVVEAVQRAGPVVQVAARPAPLGDAVEQLGQLIVAGVGDAREEQAHVGRLRESVSRATSHTDKRMSPPLTASASRCGSFVIFIARRAHGAGQRAWRLRRRSCGPDDQQGPAAGGEAQRRGGYGQWQVCAGRRRWE